MTKFEKIVVVGASLAGLRTADRLRSSGFAGELTLIGDEAEMPYDRPPLSKEVLSGVSGADDVRLAVDESWELTWQLGAAAVGLDATNKVVVTADGKETPYDGLVVATGSGARTLPVFDSADPTVHSVRTLADASRLRAVLVPGSRLLVVGCGFVGIETASSARSLGVDVVIVGMDPPVSPAGPLASATATRLIEEADVELHIGSTVARAEKTGDGHRLRLSDGTMIEADQVVVAVGSVPNVAWLAGSGAGIGDGVDCDEALRVVGLEDVVAAGDIARWPNSAFGGMRMRVEHWTNAVEQGAAAARTLLDGADGKPFGSVPSFWSDHFGVRLQSVGLPRFADRFEVTAGDPAEGVFCAEAYSGDTLVGGVAYGMPRPLVAIRLRLVKVGVDLQLAAG